MFAETSFILLCALGFDAAFGYPPALFARIGHPVSWMGQFIAALDRRFNIENGSPSDLKLAGAGALITVAGLSAAAGRLVDDVVSVLPLSFLWQALVASALLASHSLYNHVAAVAHALDEGSLPEARSAVSHIVGRDTSVLDRHGVARAAIESLAENASDGVIAPAFWFLILGLPGLAAYKAINTADSMIGHRTPRHASFGWAAARVDDIVNLPASRLTALFLTLGALLSPKTSATGALRAVFRDARHHRSPNAGWPEAAMAGALGLKLAGPRVYNTIEIKDAYMGDGRAEAEAADIWRALSLCIAAWLIMLGSLGLLAIIQQV